MDEYFRCFLYNGSLEILIFCYNNDYVPDSCGETIIDWNFSIKMKNSELYTKPRPADRVKRRFYHHKRMGDHQRGDGTGEVLRNEITVDQSVGVVVGKDNGKNREEATERKINGDMKDGEDTKSIEKGMKDESEKSETDTNEKDINSENANVNKVIQKSEEIKDSETEKKEDVPIKKAMFEFKESAFIDTVVMPSYRNQDQPQYFYVAEIRSDLSPRSPFPSPELYRTFQSYYSCKYGLEITQPDQPLLDVDHTSLRLNLITPR